MCKISIHAPTNGATKVRVQKRMSAGISIHAPTNGATSSPFDIYNPYVFQSTLRRTERPK